MKEKVILVTLDFGGRHKDWDSEEASRELEELARSAGLSIARTFIWNQKTPNSPLLLGRGKAEELAQWVEKEKAAAVVFERDLSSTQQRNLEEVVHAKTLDRTQLILDIFASRARSTEGKLQVELAQLKYLLPRLAGKGIYLSRLGGGVGTRGPGEQKLEIDKRRIREKITRLGRDLADLQKRRLAGIARKKEKNFPLIGIVGYTNAGKSSLFNRLTHSALLVKDQLFSTLDTTTRLLELPGNQKALLVDTVGFVRDLPHHLIESFKATLEEAVHADILLHVIDSSRPDLASAERSVQKVLADLGVDQKKVCLVFNKADKLTAEARRTLSLKTNFHEGFLVSSATGEGLELLLDHLAMQLPSGKLEREFFVPREQLGLLSFLYEQAEVLTRKDREEGVWVTANVTPKIESLFKSKLA